MRKKINCIMLVDDNDDDNFYHQIVIRKSDMAELVVPKESGQEALSYLKLEDNEGHYPELIFLDVNMPGMNGWEFFDEFKKLGEERQSKSVVVMLTTSESPKDKEKALIEGVSDFRTKPLTKEMLQEILQTHF